MWLRFGVFSALFVVTHASTAAGALAPVSDPFRDPKNLKVLPKHIEPGELREVMKGFALALDVRCTHCHVGKDGEPLSDYDFASDRKQEKDTARLMMRMVSEINTTLNAHFVDPGRERVKVECRTCHGGVRIPESIQSILRREIANKGVDEAMSSYRDLRSRYYGTDAYDFGADALVGLARELVGQGDARHALAMLTLALEYSPGDAQSLVGRARAYLSLGDAGRARADLEAAAMLLPDEAWIREELRKMP